jgi:hypothetical protein
MKKKECKYEKEKMHKGSEKMAVKAKIAEKKEHKK